MSRLLKKQRKRTQQQLARHVEMLGAAFAKEVGLNPRDVVLVTKRLEDGAIEQYFQTRTYDDALSKVLAAAGDLTRGNGDPEVAELAAAMEELRK